MIEFESEADGELRLDLFQGSEKFKSFPIVVDPAPACVSRTVITGPGLDEKQQVLRAGILLLSIDNLTPKQLNTLTSFDLAVSDERGFVAIGDHTIEVDFEDLEGNRLDYKLSINDNAVPPLMLSL